MLAMIRQVYGVCAWSLILVAPPTNAQIKVVAYVPNWVDLKTLSKTLDYAKLTAISQVILGVVSRAGEAPETPRWSAAQD